MALILIDGFDHYTNAQAYDKEIEYSNGSIGSVASRFGIGQGLVNSDANYLTTLNIGVNKSTIYFGIACKKVTGGSPSLTISWPWIRFRDESDVDQIQFCLNSLYGIAVYDGADALLGSTADYVVPDQRWFYLEGKITISATVGEVTLRVNETQVLNLTSQDTKNGSDYIRKISLSGIQSSIVAYYDDLYIDDAQFHGDCRIRAFTPDSISGTNNSFMASAGNKDECVDESISNDDTDYIYSDTLNHKQGFGITTGVLGTVKAIQLNNHVRIDEAGTRKIKPLIRSNGADYQGTETDEITAEYLFESEIFETDPDDAAAWTQTKLEAAEFGLEITT